MSGSVLGGHAIKILGWGEENGVPYWLAANSWNTDWGDNGEGYIFSMKTNVPLYCLQFVTQLILHNVQAFASSAPFSFVTSGYFKILRGEDHCGIESEIVAGIPM